MLCSWKELSSSTAMSSGRMSGVSHSSGCPMFPPRCTRYPAAFSSSERMVEVVVLPSLPVTAITLQGQSERKTSISEVILLPSSCAADKCGSNGISPGVRKISS